MLPRANDIADAGISLVEMLVVLAIVAMAVALVAPNTSGPARTLELETIADDLATRLREARTRAIVRSAAVNVDFDVSAKRYAATGDTRPVQMPSDVGLTLTMARSVLTESGGARLTFFPDGSATGGDISLARANRRIDIKVVWLTGAVTRVSVP